MHLLVLMRVILSISSYTAGLRAINILGPRELTERDPVPTSARSLPGPFYAFLSAEDPKYGPGYFCGVFNDL